MTSRLSLRRLAPLCAVALLCFEDAQLSAATMPSGMDVSFTRLAHWLPIGRFCERTGPTLTASCTEEEDADPGAQILVTRETKATLHAGEIAHVTERRHLACVSKTNTRRHGTQKHDGYPVVAGCISFRHWRGVISKRPRNDLLK